MAKPCARARDRINMAYARVCTSNELNLIAYLVLNLRNWIKWNFKETQRHVTDHRAANSPTFDGRLLPFVSNLINSLIFMDNIFSNCVVSFYLVLYNLHIYLLYFASFISKYLCYLIFLHSIIILGLWLAPLLDPFLTIIGIHNPLNLT